ncbi:hypothetical protein FHU33_3957 [Blastococcus colisei]|uniref:Uncharacterized protein n=1 Tax=Blastococcus colisei TaxID=1564162 RepID=A0A543NZN9_9ACTN|nr:hypothetical protein FHU33_3957 [Blastococcus colisei]
MLVVDLDGEPLAPLRALEEILLCLGTWEDDDRRDPGTDTEPLRLPPPLADRIALAAVQQLLSALTPTQSRGPGCGRLLAPDGRYEHAPMTALTLPAADIDLLSATAAALGHPRLDADIADVVDAHAEPLAGGCRPAGRTDLVSLLARLAGLLDLAHTDDTRLLTARLRATPPGTDCVLSDAEEAAHARTADRMNHIWAHGSGIDRYLY